MDRMTVKTRVEGFVKKYRYVILILLVGVGLMLIPGKQEESNQTVQTQKTEQITVSDMEAKLENILSGIQGAGRVEVMLTLASGEKTIYQTDTEKTTQNDGSSQRADTVIVAGSDRGETGLIAQVDPPLYLGAIILCQGADDPTVKLNIVDAVSKAIGLGADKISVQKMK